MIWIPDYPALPAYSGLSGFLETVPLFFLPFFLFSFFSLVTSTALDSACGFRLWSRVETRLSSTLLPKQCLTADSELLLLFIHTYMILSYLSLPRLPLVPRGCCCKALKKGERWVVEKAAAIRDSACSGGD
ncbi:uncharacterized protein F4807DRAFT_41768 [Annulohypoxylon truncatum]|uniref:uncharacterized protein n=1 Tax=Annulohypoxylon truncatum TaxID=327061 RepID=UPI00200804A3|nr:uncharacterized protein F4807DRAFT_41768 [Annulohypoxylon truncatum]KAI1210869.1 hypothetical protein F4807DRAFT_41768 [Annulohypoxylon truncatum]